MHVILGPPGSGKAGRALERVRADAAAGESVYLVVPGAIERARFLRELAGTDACGVLGVEVGTFGQLVTELAGSPTLTRTDRAMEHIVMRDALARTGGELGAIASWAGFVETAHAHINQLRRARVWGGGLLQRAEEQFPGAALSAWRALERAYDELLTARDLHDDAWFERRAQERLSRGSCRLGSVVVAGFELISEHRVRLLESLALQRRVTMTLAWRPGRLVHERAAQLRDELRARGAFVEELDERSASDPMLEFLAEELFEARDVVAPTQSGPTIPPATSPVAFVDCCGVTQECEEVVREVATLVGAGFAFDDIVVASADVEDDRALLEAAFERARIPVSVQGARRADQLPAGAALNGLLSAIADDEPLSLIAAMRSPVLDAGEYRIDQLELEVRERPAWRRGALSDPAFVRRLPVSIQRLIAAHRTGECVVERVMELMATLAPRSIGELELLQGIAATWRGLAQAAADAPVGVRDLHGALARFELPAADRSDMGKVVIASISELRSMTFPAVVLRGMHQAGFRASAEIEDDIPSASRDLLYLAVTRARQTLRVVRQAASSSGADLAPSPAWLELRRLLPNAPLRARSLAQVVVEPDDVRHSAEAAVAVAAQLAHGAQVIDVPPELRAVIAGARRAARSTTVADPVRSELADIDRLSATGLEQYTTCSAKWFIDRRLRLRNVDDDRSRLVEGTLAHELLQALAREVRLDGATADLQQRARQLADELVDRVDPHRLIDAPRMDRIARNVAATLRLEIDEEWRIPDRIGVECVLDSADATAIAPGLRIDGVEITGRVDRIDHYGSQVVVHDYKYRSSGTPAHKMIEEHRLQLLIYWLALEQPGSPIEPIAALYRAVTAAGAVSGLADPQLRELGIISRRRRSGILDADAREPLLTHARRVVGEALESLRAGVVRPLDDPAHCPAHCTFQTICRIGEGGGST